MSTIAELADDLIANPRPILCLDTCDILSAMEGLSEKNARQLEWTTRLLGALASVPGSVQPVVSYLVVHEWGQNLPRVSRKVVDFLADLDDSLKEVYAAFRFANQAPPATLPDTPPSYSTTPLTRHLIDRMQAVIDHCAAIDRDADCVERALQRVMDKNRPSHKGMIKDSINLEHYLALVQRLRDGGFGGRCLFVSANKEDFWTDRKNSTIHPDLAADLGPPKDLVFFGNPLEALASLGL